MPLAPIDQPLQPELDFFANPPPSVATGDIPDEVLRIIGHLSIHTREGHPMSAPQLATDLGIGDSAGRHVRGLIANYQDAFPFVVCATSGKGYFITEDPEQMEHYDKTLQSLVKSIACRIKSFRANASRCGFERIDSGPRVHYQERTA